MATIFPTSPAPQVNDIFQGYRYNGTSWDIVGVDLTADYQPRVASVSSTELGYLDGVTSAVQTQINAKAPLASPTFTGIVTIPAGASISGYATETYVGTAVSNLIDAAPASLDTLNELAAALGDDANYASTITTALGNKAPLYPSTNAQTGTSYTLVLADAGKYVEMNNASANTLTVPPTLTPDFPIGTEITVIQTGVGTTTIAPGSGVTINYYSPTSAATRTIKSQWAAATLIKRATNTWVLIGNLT